jgi:hypothetical protein
MLIIKTIAYYFHPLDDAHAEHINKKKHCKCNASYLEVPGGVEPP